jgi:DNA polymerase-3 subunit gamma/tau
MSQALYRKWRPARFSEVVGQEHVTRTLRNAVAADRIGHAYLFCGPRGTGKTTLARLLAKAANCLDSELAERPDNVCPPCLAVNEGRFLDLIEIDAASNTGVDDIRDLRDKINFSPSEGRYKVYIIDEVHMLSAAAFNALLKTLEEPPPHAIFVLATTEEHKVPLTIKSRCQQFNFRLLTTQEIAGRLAWMAEKEGLSVEPQAVAMIANHGAGSLRDAESLLDQLVAAPEDTITLERAQMVLGTASDASVSALTEGWLDGDAPAGLGIIHEALNSGADARQFARQIVAYLRQLLLLKAAGNTISLDVAVEQQARMSEMARRVDRRRLIEAIKHFNQAAMAGTSSWQPQLPLEMAFIESLPETAGPAPVAGPIADAVLQSVPDESRVESTPGAQAPPPAGEPPKQRAGHTDRGGHPDPGEHVDPGGQADQAGPDERTGPDDDRTEHTEQLAESDAEVAAAPPAGTLTLEKVKSNWPQMRERVGQIDKSLPALLASCKPLATEGNYVVFGFDYPILKDKFDNKKGALDTVADVIGDLVGARCAIRTVVTSQYEPATTTISKEEFTTLAEELGGVVHGGE